MFLVLARSIISQKPEPYVEDALFRPEVRDAVARLIGAAGPRLSVSFIPGEVI